MKLNKIGALCLAVLLVSSAAFAQESNSGLKIGGTIFTNYAWTMYEDSSNKNDEHRFNLERAYFVVKKNIGDHFCIKYQTDLGQIKTDGKLSDALIIYTKNAFVQYKNDFGFLGFSAQVGMVGTPITCFASKMNASRWLFIDGISSSKYLTASKKSVDTAADLGLKVNLSFAKMVNLTLMYSNGEGYKKIGDDKHASNVYAFLDINPLKPIHITAFGKMDITTSAEKMAATGFTKEQVKEITGIPPTYFGAGLAFKNKTLKIGVNYAYYLEKTNYTKSFFMNPYGKDFTAKTYSESIIDTWLNLNLKAIINLPIIVSGRFAMAMEHQKEFNPLNPSELKTTFKDTNYRYGVGLGYEFNKYVKVALYWESTIYDKDGIYTTAVKKGTDASTLFIKSQIKF